VDIYHYTDMAMVVQERRLTAPQIPLLRQELLRLRIMPNGKIDHPRSGSKDLADATCGSIFNAISHTPRNQFDTIEIVTAGSLREEEMKQREMENELNPPKAWEEKDNTAGKIMPPKREKMPDQITDWLENLRML
jgi:hypothetical protein